ncbi:MAG TPA: hypothetical protein VHE12_03845 [bacterium]|nr:hypothetical protein [bacterium]
MRLPSFQRPRPGSATLLRSAWWPFLSLLAINLFLSRLSGTDLAPILAALVLLAAVLFFQYRTGTAPRGKGSLSSREFLGNFPQAWWWVLLVLVVFLRFYHLDEPWPWPNRDEGLHGMLGLGLARHWSWQFFYTFGQHPPLLIWGLRFFLAWFHSPFLGLWLMPALAGFTAWVLGTLALRRVLSRSQALVGSALLGLGFWPFYAGRWCQQGSLILPWEMLCFLLLALVLKEKVPAKQKGWVAVLGFVTGLGSLTFTVWPVGAVMVALGLFAGGKGAPERRRELPLYFLSALSLALVPFLWAAIHEGFGRHLWSMSAASGWFPAGHQAMTVLSYFAALFWGRWQEDACYTADSGGFLDPLWGAVFFVGVVRLWAGRKDPFFRWILAGGLLGLVPGLLSMNVEMFRVIGALPFLYLITALGAESLLEKVKGRTTRRAVLFGALALALAWNGYRFLQYRVDPELHADHWSGEKGALEYRRAWRMLGQIARDQGPGWIFTEFLETPDDQTPWVTSYAFNAADNPALDPARVRWAALFVDRDYGPYLTAALPEGRAFELGQGLSQSLGRCLFLVPVNERTRARLEEWRQAHVRFRALSDAIDSINGPEAYETVQGLFRQMQEEPLPDPFVVCWFWEKKAQFLYDHGFQEHYEEQCDALRHALKGLPLFHLHYELGCLLMRRGHWEEGRRELESALKQRPGDPSVRNALSVLQDLEKKAGSPPTSRR